MASHERDGGKEQFWRDVLERQAASGLSVRKFCERERLNESNFYAWRRTIAERDQAVASKQQAAILPMVLTDQPQRSAAITIDLHEGISLRLPEPTSAERLAEVVHALELRNQR